MNLPEHSVIHIIFKNMIHCFKKILNVKNTKQGLCDLRVYFAIFAVSLIFSASAQAKTYPIQVVSRIIAPYPVYLAEYTKSGSNKLQVDLFINDITISNYMAKLHVTIEGQGISIYTDPNYLPPALSLQGGVPETYTGSDLAGYLNPNHLIFQGISKTEFLKTGKLPEGLYRFSFKVVDYNYGTQVSNVGSTIAWLILNDPPIINTPANNSKLEIFEPQNIVFQWMPRHTGSPNSAFSTEYVFKLYEMWNENSNKDILIQTSDPLFEKVTSNNRFVYGAGEPSLIPGKKYVFIIQARDVNGMDLFKNKGYSESFLFIYGDECKPPTNIDGQSLNNGMMLDWTSGSGQTGYEIKYRRVGATDDNWLYNNTIINNARIYELQPASTYEYQVKSVCGSYESGFSSTYTVDIPEEAAQVFKCGEGSKQGKITNTNPLASLVPGDKIFCGGFEAKVTEVTGGNGKFSGKCLVKIPFFNYAKVLHTFSNISVNTDNVVYQGELKSVYNKDGNFITNLE